MSRWHLINELHLTSSTSTGLGGVGGGACRGARLKSCNSDKGQAGSDSPTNLACLLERAAPEDPQTSPQPEEDISQGERDSGVRVRVILLTHTLMFPHTHKHVKTVLGSDWDNFHCTCNTIIETTKTLPRCKSALEVLEYTTAWCLLNPVL